MKLATLLVLLSSKLVVAADLYAAPAGAAGGTGAIGSPWDLQTALNHPAALHAGDTVYLRGGIYKGRFTSHVLGSTVQRVTVRSYQNEQPILDSDANSGTVLDVAADGGYTDYTGLEVRGSAPQRWGLDDLQIGFGNCPASGIGVNVLAPSTRIINFSIHDNCGGIFVSRSAVNSTLYGNLVYNNGIDAPSRGHGHSIYSQNSDPSTQLIEANAVLPAYDAAFHVYGSEAQLDNYTLRRNITLSGSQQFGGVTPMRNWLVEENIWGEPVFWRFHYSNQQNSGLNFSRNYVLSAAFPAFWWDRIYAHFNTFFSGGWKWEIRNQPTTETVLDFDDNRYIRNAPPDYIGAIAAADGSNYTGWPNLADWQAAGHDIFSTVAPKPTSQEIIYHLNAYEPKRGHVTVINWPMQDTTQIDLSRFGYVQGDAYSVADLQALGEPPQIGTYDGATPVTVSLSSSAITKPTGDLTPQCWNVDCNSCDPIPAGCYTHAPFTPAKTTSLVRAFLVRSAVAAPGPVPPPPGKKKGKPWWKFW